MICVLIICCEVIQTRNAETPTRNKECILKSSNSTNSFYFKCNEFSYFKILFKSEEYAIVGTSNVKCKLCSSKLDAHYSWISTEEDNE